MTRVLIVEDDPMWAGLLVQYCQKAGFSVVEARSPQQAMDRIDEGVVDVILLDMLLVAETGIALLNEMRGYTDLARLPVVVCTNNPVITQEVLKPFGVRALPDKSTMEPADVVVALRGALA